MKSGQYDSSSTERARTKTLNGYRNPSHFRSIIELTITIVPLAGLWTAAWFIDWLGYWWAALPVTIPTAGFLVRLFMIQHDCGHGAFFRHRWANDWVGRVIGVLTMTPYDHWRGTHAVHHATTGDLGRRGIGDVDTLTVREYVALPLRSRLMYRLYRNPIVLFGIGPTYLFLLRHRLPVGRLREGWRPWISTQATNAAIALVAVALISTIGVKAFLLVHLPTMILAATVGVWLFYVQHQFETTVWSESRDWNHHHAALYGSSHYDLPAVLRWFSANIGLHHVHHLCSRIPFYRLPRVLNDHPDLGAVSRLTLMRSFRCVSLTLWDEANQRLVTFCDASRMVAGKPDAPL